MSDATTFNQTDLAAHGWLAVQRSHSKFLANVSRSDPAMVFIDDIDLPSSQLAKTTYNFANRELPEKTFNHSLRVYYYDSNLYGTRISFEYYGAFQALSFLRENGASKDQAESVCEAIVRHADLGETGTLTSLGLLIQLSTVFDNLGANPFLIHEDTIKSVVAAFPRHSWSNCFADTMREEIRTKPHCHSTANEGFIEAVENNKLMEPWE